jgi:hypothetical protein
MQESISSGTRFNLAPAIRIIDGNTRFNSHITDVLLNLKTLTAVAKNRAFVTITRTSESDALSPSPALALLKAVHDYVVFPSKPSSGTSSVSGSRNSKQLSPAFKQIDLTIEFPSPWILIA